MILLAIVFNITGSLLMLLSLILSRNSGKVRRYKTNREYRRAKFGARVTNVIGAMFLTVSGAIINPHDFHVEAILLLIAATALSGAALTEADEFGRFEGDGRMGAAYTFMSLAVLLYASGGAALT